jgi:hypothetical protein
MGAENSAQRSSEKLSGMCPDDIDGLNSFLGFDQIKGYFFVLLQNLQLSGRIGDDGFPVYKVLLVVFSKNKAVTFIFIKPLHYSFHKNLFYVLYVNYCKGTFPVNINIVLYDNLQFWVGFGYSSLGLFERRKSRNGGDR